MIAVKDQNYLAFVRSQPCCVSGCRVRPCEAHHRIGYNRRYDYGDRTSDHEAMPICNDHHSELHDHGWQTFEDKYHFNQLKAALTTLSAYIQYLRAIEDAPI